MAFKIECVTNSLCCCHGFFYRKSQFLLFHCFGENVLFFHFWPLWSHFFGWCQMFFYVWRVLFSGFYCIQATSDECKWETLRLFWSSITRLRLQLKLVFMGGRGRVLVFARRTKVRGAWYGTLPVLLNCVNVLSWDVSIVLLVMWRILLKKLFRIYQCFLYGVDVWSIVLLGISL